VPVRGRPGQRVENFEIQIGSALVRKEIVCSMVGQIERNGVRQRLLHLPDGAEQRPFEIRAAILLERLFGDDEREEFALGNLNVRKGADLPRYNDKPFCPVRIPPAAQPVAHELDVAMNRLGGDFDFARERGGVGEFAGLKRLMNAQHSLQRRTRMERPCCRHSWRRLDSRCNFIFSGAGRGIKQRILPVKFLQLGIQGRMPFLQPSGLLKKTFRGHGEKLRGIFGRHKVSRTVSRPSSAARRSCWNSSLRTLAHI